jgi:hypothetical protein
MLQRSSTVISLIAAVCLVAVAMLYVAYGHISAAPGKDSTTFLFWMELVKPLSQMLYLTLGGGIVAGLLKILFDSVQARRQIDAAKDQFRKQLIEGFVDARYGATGKRDKFLSAPSARLDGLYRSMMEDEFIGIKEKLSRIWHDVETGKQSLTHGEAIEGKVIAMKEFFDHMLAEYRSIKDSRLPDTMKGFEELRYFGDFLTEGDDFNSFITSYRDALRLLRLDMLGEC